jgi:hypothetical protein
MAEVSFQSGHRAEDRPISLTMDGKYHRIVEVLESRIVEDYASRNRRREYVVRIDTDQIYELSERGGWVLRRL